MADHHPPKPKLKISEFMQHKGEKLHRQMRREEKDHLSWKDRLRKEREAYNT
jgi:hypothetical protein